MRRHQQLSEVGPVATCITARRTSSRVLRRTISVAVGVCRMSVSMSRSPLSGKSPRKRSPDPANSQQLPL